MDRRIYFVSSFLVMIIFVGIFLITLPQPIKQPAQTQFSQPQPTAAVLSVAAYACQKGKTALEILQDISKVETQGTSSAKVVTSINGSTEGEGKNWVYSINEKEATVSASSFICQGEEVIRWELK